MIRTYNGKLIKVNKETFKNDYNYYRFLWKQKYNFKLNNSEKLKDNIKKLVK